MQAAAERRQGLLQLADALPDEVHPPIGARQGIQNLGVEDERAVHRAVGAQRGVQGGVIEGAQVAPEPDEGGGVQSHGLK